MELNVFAQVAIALAIGLLVGLQREWAAKRIAGIRTFALLAVFGALCGILAGVYGGLLVLAGFLAVAVMVVVANVIQRRDGEKIGPGFTTEIAAFIIFALGALVPAGFPLLAVVCAASVSLILYWKQPLHEFTRSLGEADFRAIATFTLVALVILPLLPEKAYGPYGFFNPFKIWLFVVLIVGISFLAYITHRVLAPRAGTLLAGILGGLISSTATTVSYSKHGKLHPNEVPTVTAVILIASTVVFARVLVEIWLVAGKFFTLMAPAIAVFMVAMGVLSMVALRLGAKEAGSPATPEPPLSLGAAISFGCIYALVLLAVAMAKNRFGDQGLYLLAIISGLTDMDAITLSTSELVARGELAPGTAGRAILIGGLANIFFKGGLVMTLGPQALRSRIALYFAIALLAGSAILLGWNAL